LGAACYGQNDLVPIFVPSSTPAPVTDTITKKFTNIGSDLPDFRIVTLPEGHILKKREENGGVEKTEIIKKGREITKKSLAGKNNLFIMLFNPDCQQCYMVTERILHDIELFKKSKLLMVARQNTGLYLQDFERVLHINKYPNIIIGLDSSNLTKKLYRYIELPQVNVYDKNRKLIRIFEGNFSMDSLKTYIQ
jgi:hypothetical protein